MYDVINSLDHLIVPLQMETGNVPDRANNISVFHWAAKCDGWQRNGPKSDPI